MDKTKKREWVKTAIIVFLAILLVLTFFSNTIMNRTLPEVASQMVTSSQVNPRVRGTGTITAAQTYSVEIDESRKVKTVYAKAGEEVSAGDLLFVLSDEDSDELEAAKDELQNAQFNYRSDLINSSNAVEDLEVQRLRDSIAEYEEILTTYPEPQMSLLSATDARDTAKEAYEKAKSSYDSISGFDTLTRARENAEAELLALRLRYCADETYHDTGLYSSFCKHVNLQYMKDEQVKFVESFKDFTDEQFINIIGNQLNNKYFLALASTYKQYESMEATNFHVFDDNGADTGTVDTYAEQRYKEYKAYTEIKSAYDKYIAALDAEKQATNTTAAAGEDLIAEITANYNNAKAAYEEAEATLTSITKYEEAEKNLEDAQYNLETKIAQSSVSNAQNALTIEKDKLAIEKAQEKVDKLSDTSQSNEIYAEVSGKIASVSISAGNTTTPKTALCTIEVPDMGYQTEIKVTADQAKRLQVGAEAEVQTSWWGSYDITARLVSIHTDPQSPQTGKVLVFDVSGSDVQSGSSITISIGEKGSTYETVVPKSAIRTDSQGSFVLMITSKSSPLGNRYYAKKIEVNVTASDDTLCAVTGGIAQGDYVITTSSAPIENGDQVRMAES